MIAGEPDLYSVALHVGHAGKQRPFRMTEIAGFLASRGFLLGTFAQRPATWKRRIRIRWAKSHDALLIVAKSSGTGTHAVYWSGGRVLDPERVNAGKSLRDYRVLEWWPVIKVEG